MKKTIAFSVLFISIIFCKAGWENPVSLRYTPNSPSPYTLQPSAVLDVKDTKYPSTYTSGWATGFLNKTVVNKIVLGIDVNQGSTYYTAYTINAQLKIEGWDASGTAMTPVYPTLTLSYNPARGAKEDLKTVYSLTGYHRVKVTVINIINTATSTPFYPQHIYVENFLQVERYYTVTPSSTAPGSSFASGVSQNGTTLSGQELEVSWNPLASNETPEAYELEWTYSQDYQQNVGTSPTFDYIFNVNFKNNATNVIIKNTSYKIPLVYPMGLIAWRVRAIYVDFSNLNLKKYTEWSSVDVLTVNRENGTSVLKDEGGHTLTNALIVPGFDDTKNWQYGISFAEEGKNKVVISYYDGLLRSRQSVTRVNSDQNAVVGQTIYDFTGRPAIQVLPVPTINNLSLSYREEFNNSAVAGEPNYTWKHFDVDATGNCTVSKTHAMSEQYGASRYYSSSTPGFAQLGGDRIPQAEGYPFSQVEYMPDNTGRVRRQGGVGLQHRLTGTNENDVNKTGHETKYFYGTPNGQRELFRLFGNEIGDYKHYKKNLIIDANGQISISYLDPQGRVVASALAGDAANTPNLDEIATPVIEDWEEYENTEVDYNDFTLTSHRTIAVEKAGQYDFYYKIASPKYTDACMPINFCFDCIYDLEISVKNLECGEELIIPGNLKYMSGLLNAVNPPALDNSCSDSIVLELRPDNLGASYEPLRLNLAVGRYTVSKKLTVSKKALAYYKEQYLANLSGNCIKTFADFIAEEKLTLDYTKCNYTCQQCYIDAGSDNEKIAQCDEFCNQKDECYGLLLTMQQDMAVGGQYFDNIQITPMDVISTPTPDPNDASFKYDGGRTNINDWLNRRAPQSSTVKVNFFSTFNARFATGGAAQFTDWSDIRNRWQPEFAEELVKLHPEYCYYEKCLELKASHQYDQKLMSVNDGSEALSKGYFNPIQMTNPDVNVTKYPQPSNTDRDPFFFDAYGPKSPEWGTMKNYLLNITDGTTVIGTAWGLVDNNQAAPGAAKPESGDPSGCLSDYDWQYFRALYLAQKQNFYNAHYQTCNLGATVVSGGETYNELIDAHTTYNKKTRRFFHGADDAFNKKLGLSLNQAPGGDVTDLAANFCNEQCDANADLWMEDLKGCNFSVADLAILKNELIAICELSCDEGGELGASSAQNYTTNGNHTFEEAINWMIKKGGYKVTDICNPLLVSFPSQGTSHQKLMVPLDDCACDKVSLNAADYQQKLSAGTLPSGVCSEAELFAHTYGVSVDDLELLSCLCANNLNRIDAQASAHFQNPCYNYYGGIPACVNGVSYKANNIAAFIQNILSDYNLDAPSISTIGNPKTIYPGFFGAGSLIYPNSNSAICFPQISFGAKTTGFDIDGNYIARNIILSDNCGFSCTLTLRIYYTGALINFSDVVSTTANSNTDAATVMGTVIISDTPHLFKISTCYYDLECNSNLFVYPEVFVPAEIACQKCLTCTELQTHYGNFFQYYSPVLDPTVLSQVTAKFTDYLNYKLGYNYTTADIDALFSECLQGVTCTTTPAANALKALFDKMILRGDLGKTGINFNPIDYPEFFNPAIYSGSPSDTPKIENNNPYYAVFQPGSGYTYNFLTGQFSIDISYPLNVIDGVQFPVVVKITALTATTGNTVIYIGDSLGGGNSFIIPPLSVSEVYYINALVNPILLPGDPNLTILWIYGGSDYPFAQLISIPYGTALTGFVPNVNNLQEFTITDKNGLNCKVKFKLPDGLLISNIESILSIAPEPFTNTMKATVLMKGSTEQVEILISYSCQSLNDCGSLAVGVNKCPAPIPSASTSSCSERLDEQAEANAWSSYQEYLKDKANEFEKNYLDHCMHPFEKFGSTHRTQQYQLTLYYYDQGDNLVKTIPPKGVKLLAPASIDSAMEHFKTPISKPRIKPNHEFITHYTYNTLNQLVEQFTKDGGISKFWYDRLGRLVLSQNAKQATGNKYSYTLFDEQGRIKEVGELTTTATINAENVADESWLASTISSAITTSTQITKTFYDDKLLAANTVPGFTQDNLRKRIATVAYYENYVTDNLTLTRATHYTYDVQGNVKQLVQDNPDLNRFQERFKTIHYNYDLMSGKTNMVAYQPDSLDRFYHYYQYDADNRLKAVYTSRNAKWQHLQQHELPDIPNSPDWVQDAKYDYYKHGPMVRMELGENKVQGLDYAYTIHGWLKAVNSTFALPYTDGNQDGFNVMGIAQDAFGFELGYYNGDYKPASARNPYPVIASQPTGNSLTALQSSLYNGNISYMVTSLPDSLAYTSNVLTNKPMANLFRYDQLNRLSRSRILNFNAADLPNDRWLNHYDSLTDYYMKLSYDPNGNILYMQRNGEAGNTAMDGLTYHYDGNTNKLTYVDDNVTTTTAHYEDIDDQSPNNYAYDAIGNLIQDNAEEIATIEWTVYGKIKKITRTAGSTKPDLEFEYNATGQRVMKKVIPIGLTPYLDDKWYDTITTYYVRDASGNIMATYEHKYTYDPDLAIVSENFKIKECDLYGSSRLGVIKVDVDEGSVMASRDGVFNSGGQYEPNQPEYTFYTTTTSTTYTIQLGNKNYELCNQLGNVLVTITDRKVPVNSAGTIDHHIPDIATVTDYYPFGMVLEKRSWSITKYRFGFNGQEKDNEVSGEGNSVTAEFWQYDSRLGRRWNLDPILKSNESLYSTFGDNPIYHVDPNGDDWYENNNYDKNNVSSKQYEWFEGSATKTGYTHLGEYLVTTSKTANTMTFQYQQQWTVTLDLNTDMGKKFSMVALEGGFVEGTSGRGTKVNDKVERESLYGLFIISASMENRLASTEYNKDGTYEGLFKGQYDAATGNWKTRIVKKDFELWGEWYGKGAVMQYFADVLTASQGEAAYTLNATYGMKDSHRIFAYAHNNEKPSDQCWKGYMMTFNNTKTLINVVSTADWVPRTTPWYLEEAPFESDRKILEMRKKIFIAKRGLEPINTTPYHK